MGLMISQSHERRHIFLFSSLIVLIDISQFLNYIAALLREAICYIDGELPVRLLDYHERSFDVRLFYDCQAARAAL